MEINGKIYKPTKNERIKTNKRSNITRRIKYPYSFGCVLAHSCFNSYAPERVPICYSVDKHGCRCFIS